MGQSGFDEEATLVEVPQDPTEIAMIETELGGDLGCN